MGCRVHVVKQQREYGNTEAFNWEYTTFYKLLGELGCDVCQNDDEYSNFAEVPVEDFETAVRVLKAKRDGVKPTDEDLEELGFESIDEMETEEIDKCIKTLGYDLKDLCDILDRFYEERDQKSGWVQFEAW